MNSLLRSVLNSNRRLRECEVKFFSLRLFLELYLSLKVEYMWLWVEINLGTKDISYIYFQYRVKKKSVELTFCPEKKSAELAKMQQLF